MRIGLVCNQATVGAEFQHIIPIFHQSPVEVGAIFGPQHGLYGHTQDNMIEWEGGTEALTGAPLYSLYGERREPTQESLQNLDALVIDLPDIGARYYTFIWTTALCMKAAAQKGIPVFVLDRPNPLGGVNSEGTLVEPGYESFVGLHPLPMRHGLTLGEIATRFADLYYPEVKLQVIRVEDWNRTEDGWQSGAPWAMPSPNMPTLETAWVYPGMCLLEGTNLSEGRGTTKPFEIFGACFMDGHAFVSELAHYPLPGVVFRPLEFQPTFHKFSGQICGGAFMHVVNRKSFRPVATALAILHLAIRLYPRDFSWKLPPYEYEFVKLPIEILLGNSWVRRDLEAGRDFASLLRQVDSQHDTFQGRGSLLYPS